MRVLLISQEFPPETGWGGIGTYAGIIAPALVRAGAEVHVLSVIEGQARSTRTGEGVHVHRAPLRRPRGVGRALGTPIAWQRLCGAATLALEHRRLGLGFDVWESPEWGAEGLVLALRRAVPSVVRLHSGGAQVLPFIGPIQRDRRQVIKFEEALIRRADVVTGTRALTSTVPVELGVDPDRVRTIRYPVARVQPLPPPADERGGGDAKATVAFVGRFEARKGPDVLVRAVPRLLERVPEARVVLRGRDTPVLGHGSFLEDLRRQIAELGIAHAVELIDDWHPDAVVAELRRAAVCAVPSRWESFGLVAAEAAALGRPVVASRIAGLDDVVDDGVTGRLVPPEEPAALADAIADLLESPDDRRRMGAAAANDIAHRCDPDRIAAETMSAYELAIENFGRRHGRRRNRFASSMRPRQ
ncbi:MAG: glycosyltransferase family 4 protein [Solirubrobacterales bacterium]